MTFLPCRKRPACWILLALAAIVGSPARLPASEQSRRPASALQIELVFCLDTTGSMGGLIEGAKQKIWTICNQVAGGKPTPRLKVGLVPFRDRGDVYVTRVIDLTEDLDEIHGQLQSFRAEGGGDEPESVNQALYDAVTRVSWSKDAKALRLLFLVGDAPPHMDYPDDVKYPVTCKMAAEKGIIINTVQCGASDSTRKYWQDICRRAEGSYVRIAQDGGVVAIATPFDHELEAVNVALTKTTLTFGDVAKQERDRLKTEEAMRLPAVAGAADRVAFGAKNAALASYDLIDNLNAGNVRLQDLRRDQLPPELQGLDAKAQQAHIDRLEKKRTELRQQALALDKKRADYIAKEQTKHGNQNGFDTQVVDVLRKQAERAGIKY
jgi:Mg-chelatase subunit ChlD